MKVLKITSILLAFIGLSLLTPSVAQAENLNADQILERVVTGWTVYGETTFTFNTAGDLQQTAQAVSDRFPTSCLPYVTNYTFHFDNDQLTIKFNSNQPDRDVLARKEVEKAAQAISKEPTDRKRFNAAFNHVVKQTTYYNNENGNNIEQTMSEAIFAKRANCNGFATWLVALLNESGVPAVKIITATPGMQDHAVVMVFIEGKWVYSDPSSYAFNIKNGTAKNFMLYSKLDAKASLKNTNATKEQCTAILREHRVA